MAEFQRKRSASSAKPANIDQSVSYLSRAFSKATQRASGVIGTKAVRSLDENNVVTTTKLYDYQVEFCYLINEITAGCSYMVPKRISEANELITQIEALVD